MQNLFFVETSNELLLIWRTSFCDRFITYIFETNTEYLYDIFRPPFSPIEWQFSSITFAAFCLYLLLHSLWNKNVFFSALPKISPLTWKCTVQMLFVKHTKKPSLIRNCRKIFRLRLSSLKISDILLNHKIHAISWMWLHALFPPSPLSSFVLQLFCFVPFVCNVWLCLNVVHIIRKKSPVKLQRVKKNGFSATHWIINRFIASSVNIYRKSITIFREYLITFICAKFINLIENCRYTKLFILPRRSSI